MSRLLLFSFLLLVLVLSASSEQAATAQPTRSAAEVERLVRQLGSESFAEREEASKALSDIGEPALDALRKAAGGNDLEVRLRAELLVRAIRGRMCRELRCFTGHAGEATGVAFSPDGRQVLSAGRDGTIRFWDIASGKERQLVKDHQVCQVAFSPDGRRALSGALGKMPLWDVTTGKAIRYFSGHGSGVSSVAFSPDGKRALSGGGDGTLILWDIESGREVRQFVGHRRTVWAVAFSPDGKRALSGCEDQTARLWDVPTGKELNRFAGHFRSFLGVAFSPDGRRAVTCGEESAGAVRMWDVDSGREVRRFNSARCAYSVAFSPDGRRVLWGERKGSLQLRDVESEKEVWAFSGHKGTVNCVSFSADGRRAVSGGQDKTVRLWQLPK